MGKFTEIKKNIETKTYSDKDMDEKIENAGREVIPTDMKRIIVPVFGFDGAVDSKRPEWGADGEFMEDVKGLEFNNPKDNCKQILKQKDGCLIMYDGEGRQKKVEDYLKGNPNALTNSENINKFIEYLKKEVVAEGGKADLWDTDTSFASGLKDAPAKEDIKVGQVFSSVKKKEVAKALFVEAGTKFQGPAETPQIADKEGAYLVKDSAGTRMVQKKEFLKAYEFKKANVDPRAINNKKQNG